MVVTNKTEQGRQYKEYSGVATGSKAERSAQLLGGEFFAARIAQYHNQFGRQPWSCLFFCSYSLAESQTSPAMRSKC